MSYIFGNIGDDGNLDAGEWDEEVKDSLQKLPANFLSQITGEIEEGNSVEDVEANRKRGNMIKPLGDAIDFGDIDELAPDQLPQSSPAYSTASTASVTPKKHTFSNNRPRSNLSMVSPRTPNSNTPKKSAEEIVKEAFPFFEKHKVLRFSDLFAQSIMGGSNHDKKLRPSRSLWRFQEEDLLYATDDEELVISSFLSKKRKDEMQLFRMETKSMIQNNQLSFPGASNPNGNNNNEICSFYQKVFEELENQRTKFSSNPVGLFRFKESLSPEESKELDENIEKMMQEARPFMDSWEERIVWDESENSRLVDHTLLRGLYANSFDIKDESQLPQLNSLLLSMWKPMSNVDELIIKTVTKIKNYDFEFGDWDQRIIWDESSPPAKFPLIHLILNKNDPFFVFDDTISLQEVIRNAKVPGSHNDHRNMNRNKRTHKPVHSLFDPSKISSEEYQKSFTYFKNVLDRFNLSNDRYYDNRVNRAGRVRHTFGQSTVQHSQPALKLLPALFKCTFSRAELRNFHRSPLNLEPNVKFSIGARSKSLAVGKYSASHNPKTIKELCLHDGLDYVLMEYSEEYPPIIMNISMGALINNYYRKKNEMDDYVPVAKEGAVVVLEEVDASPFFMFGEVKPGQQIACLYNNLFRAPIFAQPTRSSDFLLIRHTSKKEVRYFIRKIPGAFVVGQTFPLQEVPGIHSRRVNIYMKNRVQFTAWRLFKNSELAEKAIRINRIFSLFKNISDTNIRKWLKEFAEGSRKGKESGVWVLKKNVVTPTDEELKKMVSPEAACVYESMLAGQQRLKDAGYVQVSDEINEDDEEKLEDEVKLAPWIVTRNFVNASQRKAMLKLYGPGDPTGRGEGFSFMRASMKAMFFREGEDPDEVMGNNTKFSIDEQQQAYKDEIQRIWNAQLRALSNTNDVEVDESEINNSTSAPESQRNESLQGSRVQSPTGMPTSHWPLKGKAAFLEDDDNASMASFGSRASSALNAAQKQKILTIERKVLVEGTGEIVTETEVISDPRVINAYLRQKQLLEARKLALESANGTGVVDNVPTVSVNQDGTSQVLNPFKAVEEVNPFASGGGSSNPDETRKRKTMTLRCSSCGQVGHNKNNKNCPNYRENIMEDQLLLSLQQSPSTPTLTETPNHPASVVESNSAASDADVKIQGTKISISKSAIKLVALKQQQLKERRKSGASSHKRNNSSGEAKEAVVDPIEARSSTVPPVQTSSLLSPDHKPSPLSKNVTPTTPATGTKRKRSTGGHPTSTVEDVGNLFSPLVRKRRPLTEFSHLLENIWTELTKLPNSWPFREPVKPKDAPSYYYIIKHPKDLGAVRNDICNLRYTTVNAFMEDIRLILNNCITFNGETHAFSYGAKMMLSKAEELIRQNADRISELEKEIQAQLEKAAEKDNPNNNQSSQSGNVITLP